MRTDWMKKLQNPEGGTALLLEFLAALLMVQGLAGIRSLDFRFVLPWLLLLLFMAKWRKPDRKAWIGGLAGAVLFAILYFAQSGTSGVFSTYVIVVLAGGFLLGEMVWNLADRWRKDREVFSKLLAGGVLLLTAIGLFWEGVLRLENAAQAVGVFAAEAVVAADLHRYQPHEDDEGVYGYRRHPEKYQAGKIGRREVGIFPGDVLPHGGHEHQRQEKHAQRAQGKYDPQPDREFFLFQENSPFHGRA